MIIQASSLQSCLSLLSGPFQVWYSCSPQTFPSSWPQCTWAATTQGHQCWGPVSRKLSCVLKGHNRSNFCPRHLKPANWNPREGSLKSGPVGPQAYQAWRDFEALQSPSWRKKYLVLTAAQILPCAGWARRCHISFGSVVQSTSMGPQPWVPSFSALMLPVATLSPLDKFTAQCPASSCAGNAPGQSVFLILLSGAGV